MCAKKLSIKKSRHKGYIRGRYRTAWKQKERQIFFFPWEQQSPILEWWYLREWKTSPGAEVRRTVTAVKCGRLHRTLLAVTHSLFLPSIYSGVYLCWHDSREVLPIHGSRERPQGVYDNHDATFLWRLDLERGMSPKSGQGDVKFPVGI